jgi:pimeloyl-ACP methyl ester carboxylesterase
MADFDSFSSKLPLLKVPALMVHRAGLACRVCICAIVSCCLLAAVGAVESQILSGKMTLPENGASMPRTNLPKSKVSEAKPERWFRIKAPNDTVLNVTVTGPFYKPRNGLRGKSSALHELTAEIACELLDANEQPIADSDRAGVSAEFLRRVRLAAGTYYLRVRYVGAGPEEDRTDVLVLLSAGADWSVVSSSEGTDGAGEAHHVGLLPVPAKGLIQANRATWITTHGRSDAPGGREDGPGTFFQVAKALALRAPEAQQALLDWTTAAAPKNAFDLSGGRWFAKIGGALAERLADPAAPRLTGAQLNLVGHSWGTYVNVELADAIREEFDAGKVSRFIALDPALTAGNYDVSAANLSGDSEYSFALYTSGFGNEHVSQTAHDSFNVEVEGTTSVFDKHNAAHEYLRDLLRQTDRISVELRSAVFSRGNTLWERDPLFYNSRMVGAGVVGTLPTPADGGFEGVLSIVRAGTHWRPASLLFAQP